MDRRRFAAVIVAASLLLSFAPAKAAVSFTTVKAFATKTGIRAVVTWQASEPVAGRVQYGTASNALNEVALPVANVVDRAQMALLENLTENVTYYYRVVDTISGVASPVATVRAGNAWNSYDSGAKSYTINLLAVLDSQALPDSVPWDIGLADIAGGINILAERIFDATDGWLRIGTVLVTDTSLNYPVNVPARGLPGCRSAANVPVGGTPADFLIQTTVPFDSHTWLGPQIESNCTGIYLGRLGWLVVPWINDLDLGYTMAHELAHYAFNAPDLYTATSAGCINDTWNGSLMTNVGGWVAEQWRFTELDRNQSLTPCNHSASPDWSWAKLKEYYVNVPAPTAPKLGDRFRARGNPDGGKLEIWILDHSVNGLSRLQRCLPNDTAPGCTNL